MEQSAMAQSTVTRAERENRLRVQAEEVVPGVGTRQTELLIVNQQLVGFGVFSNVYSAELVEPQRRRVAIKKTWPADMSWARQYDVLKDLDHFLVVRLLYVFQPRPDCWNLIFEYMDTTVRDREVLLHSRGGRIHAFDARLWSYQLFAALDYLSTKAILHRDVKPENLLLETKTNLLKLADFGSAKRLVDGQRNEPYSVTRYFRAPELCLGNGYYGLSVDWWAAACVSGGLMMNGVLFNGRDSNEQLHHIERVLGTPSPADQLAMLPKPSALAKPHKWHSYAKADWTAVIRYSTPQMTNFLERLLVYDPQQRMAPNEALHHAYFDDLRVPGQRQPGGAALPFRLDASGTPQHRSPSSMAPDEPPTPRSKPPTPSMRRPTSRRLGFLKRLTTPRKH